MSDSNSEADKWPLNYFLTHFMNIHDKHPDDKFCFILGAGASKSSNIPMTDILTEKWLEILRNKSGDTNCSLSDWATSENLEAFGIKNFDYSCREAFYSSLFKACFKDCQAVGRATIEEIIQGKQPSIGYLALAKIMSIFRHNLVITTNFDNLVSDSLTVYFETYPRVILHENLTSFAKPTNQRPVIAKIHNDWLFNPNNDKTDELPKRWKTPLSNILKEYTPIVLGYAGNDGGLMNFLENSFRFSTNKEKHNMYWLYYYNGNLPEEKDLPNQRIRKLIKKHNGVLIPHRGFDATMIELCKVLKIRLPDDLGIQMQIQHTSNNTSNSIASRAITRERHLLEEYKAVHREQVRNGLINMETSKMTWEDWERQVRQEVDDNLKIDIYTEALRKLPRSFELMGNFAHLMKLRKNFPEAEDLYRKALKIQPNDAMNNGNIAFFLEHDKKEFQEAENFYRIAISLDRNGAINNARYAFFLLNQKRYKPALEKAKHTLNCGHIDRWAARSALCAAIILNKLGQNAGSALGRLNTLLSNGFERGDSLFYGVLELACNHLTHDKRKFYKALSRAIEDPSKLNGLNEFAEWNNIKPINLIDPWEN